MDITDHEELSAFLSDAVDRRGPLRGVVHAAGVINDSLLPLKSHEEVENVLAPKIYGTLVLDMVLQERPLDFFVLCSSISAVVAPAGQADYVAANAFLNAYARSRSSRSGQQVVSLGWGVWREVGIAACEAAEAKVLEAKAGLRLAQVELGKTILRAPFDGIVAELSAEVGEWVTPSPPAMPVPPVVELIQQTAIYVSAPLDEVDLSRVGVGQLVRITLDAYADREFSGRLTRVAPYVLDLEEHSRTVEIEVEFDDAEFAAKLLPGTSADVEVILASEEDVLRIPSYALIEGSRVLVIHEGELAPREVETGLRNWAFVKVESGLEVGEAVVVSLDRAEVREGVQAVIVEETLR